MRLSAFLLAPVALLGLSLSAQAADLTFDITDGTLSPSGTFSGSFLINTSEFIDGGSFTVTAPAGGTVYNFAGSGITSSIPGAAFFTDGLGDTLRLAINGTLSDLTINTLIPQGQTQDTAVFFGSGVQYDATGGIISVPTPASAATPEPSSLIMLGTGALGVAGAMRRRLVG